VKRRIRNPCVVHQLHGGVVGLAVGIDPAPRPGGSRACVLLVPLLALPPSCCIRGWRVPGRLPDRLVTGPVIRLSSHATGPVRTMQAPRKGRQILGKTLTT
jgi:hypothetical protein